MAHTYLSRIAMIALQRFSFALQRHSHSERLTAGGLLFPVEDIVLLVRFSKVTSEESSQEEVG